MFRVVQSSGLWDRFAGFFEAAVLLLSKATETERREESKDGWGVTTRAEDLAFRFLFE